LTMIVSPLWTYLQGFTVVIVMAVIGGIVVLLAYPKHRTRVALTWVAIGVFQVLFSSFYTYVPGVSDGFLNGLLYLIFPNEVAFGLFILTCGVIVAAFRFPGEKPRRRLFSLGMVLLGCLELIPFIDFSLKFPDLNGWNIWVNATPYIAFLSSAVATLSCLIIAQISPRHNTQNRVKRVFQSLQSIIRLR